MTNYHSFVDGYASGHRLWRLFASERGVGRTVALTRLALVSYSGKPGSLFYEAIHIVFFQIAVNNLQEIVVFFQMVD